MSYLCPFPRSRGKTHTHTHTHSLSFSLSLYLPPPLPPPHSVVLSHTRLGIPHTYTKEWQTEPWLILLSSVPCVWESNDGRGRVRSGLSQVCLPFSLLIENEIAVPSAEWLRAHCTRSLRASQGEIADLIPITGCCSRAVDLCGAQGSSGHTRAALSSARTESSHCLCSCRTPRLITSEWTVSVSEPFICLFFFE